MSDILTCHVCGKQGVLIGELRDGHVYYYCPADWEAEREKQQLFQINQQ